MRVRQVTNRSGLFFSFIGRRSFANHALVLLVVNDERYNGKVGFAAGKKLGGAVVRNRVNFKLY
ncbi:MAG: ribonuclease P protein component [Selenomonadaceae bacterium]|nr:ribonuclease P protein component [Selenomonadaceae bacterium]MBQ6131094.1 ribonuclease P protein component [Selenomonadaceae bacterium]MBQ7493550.1 ribonuclease P protein component [Selenomonadaceae bacterium]